MAFPKHDPDTDRFRHPRLHLPALLPSIATRLLDETIRKRSVVDHIERSDAIGAVS